MIFSDISTGRFIIQKIQSYLFISFLANLTGGDNMITELYYYHTQMLDLQIFYMFKDEMWNALEALA